jgi:hypothetical protein
MYPYPRPPKLPYPARVLSSEGALLEALLKWGRARAGRRGNPKVDAAPAAVPRKHGPGGPWVTVRAHYGALPSMAGRGRTRGGRKPARAKAKASAGSRKHGPKDEEVAATERRKALPCASVFRRSGKQAAAVTKVRLSALRLPSRRGDKLKAQLARRRGNASAWLFESSNQNLRMTSQQAPRHTRA